MQSQKNVIVWRTVGFGDGETWDGDGDDMCGDEYGIKCKLDEAISGVKGKDAKNQ